MENGYTSIVNLLHEGIKNITLITEKNVRLFGASEISETFRSVIDVLIQAYEKADKGDCRNRSKTFSVELEPGQCFALRDLETLRLFKKSITQLDKKQITLNIDVGHYLAAGIPVDEIASIADYVSHSHLSIMQRKTNQHYRDLPIIPSLYPQEWTEIRNYLQTLDQVFQKQNTTPKSASVSLELEGNGVINYALQSLEKIKF